MGVNITNLQLYSLGGYYLDWVLIFAGLKKKKVTIRKSSLIIKIFHAMEVFLMLLHLQWLQMAQRTEE